MREVLSSSIPKGWQKLPLEQLLVRMSNGISKRQTKDGKGLPVTRIETISKGIIDLSRVGYLSDLTSSEIKKYRLECGDLLFSHINSDLHLGKTAVFSMEEETLLHGMNLLLIRVDTKKILPIFLHWLFNCYRIAGLFMSIAQHAVNQSSINQRKLNTLPILVPPLPEQRRIVAEIEKQFSRLEEGVSALKRVQANLKRYRAAVLKAACEGQLVENEVDSQKPASSAKATATRKVRNQKEYESGEQLLKRILDERRKNWQGRGQYKEPEAPDTTNLPKLPEGWTWSTAEQLTDENRSITYGVIKLGTPVVDGVHVLRSSDVRHLRLDLEDVKRVAPEIAGEYRRTFLKGGEVLITVRGTLGGVVVAPVECVGFNISREVAMLAMVKPCVAKTVAIFIGSTPLQRWLLQRAKGIAYTGINIETLKKLPIPLPPLAEQQRIVEEVERRLSVIDELESLVTANLQRASRLRQAVLQKAFEGRLVNKKELI